MFDNLELLYYDHNIILKEVIIIKVMCPFENCKYEWLARVEKPKTCPKCKRYLNNKKKQA